MFEDERVFCEIDLNAIENNAARIKALTNSRFMAVVKGDGYGHGAPLVAKSALSGGADCLGVAILEEGMALRQAGIGGMVLILGFTPDQKLSKVIDNDLTQTVFNKEMALALSCEAQNLKKEALIHIKVDTGMGRIGFSPVSSSIEDIMEISRLPGISITGVYSHFADSDSQDREFTVRQYNKFLAFTTSLMERGLQFTRHISNSGAVIQYPEMSLDLVRSGILLYGLAPSYEMDIEGLGFIPAMSMKTRIINLKSVEEGVSVGYSRSYFTRRRTMVATAPAGYADGFSRLLSNRGKVIVCEKYAPVIGKVCMDQFMIDVTGIDGVEVGSEITILGRSGSLEITAWDIGRIEGAISYEVLCGIGKRVPRIYIN